MNVRKIDTFSGHRDCVYTLISDPNGRWFYSAGGDGLVVRWDVSKPDLGELIAQVGASVYAMALDGDTGLLWAGHNYEGIQVLDPTQKQAVASMKIGPSPIFDIKIWREKAYLALGDGVIVVIDIPTFAIQKYLKASQKSVRSLAIREESAELVAGFSDMSVSIFDLTSLTLKKRFQAHTNSVFSVNFSPDQRWLVTGGRDAHLKVWDVLDNYRLAHDIPAHLFAINHIAYRADGAFLATASMDKSIKIWDATTFRLVKVIDRARHAGHGTSINRVLWVKEKNLLVSGSDDRTISVWEIQE